VKDNYMIEDEKRPAKVFRIELCLIVINDADSVTEDGIITAFENCRSLDYPQVTTIESCEVAWNDNHPLNHKDISDYYFRKLFTDPTFQNKERKEVKLIRERDKKQADKRADMVAAEKEKIERAEYERLKNKFENR
jgi:hypothetical protein